MKSHRNLVNILLGTPGSERLNRSKAKLSPKGDDTKLKECV